MARAAAEAGLAQAARNGEHWWDTDNRRHLARVLHREGKVDDAAALLAVGLEDADARGLHAAALRNRFTALELAAPSARAALAEDLRARLRHVRGSDSLPCIVNVHRVLEAHS